MTLFLDASVLLAACGSDKGASSEIFRLAPQNDWILVAIPYVLDEVASNLSDLSSGAREVWKHLQSQLVVQRNVLSLDRPVVFTPAKDRPILFSALAWTDVLLTLDTRDFGELVGNSFYGLSILRPGAFLERERALNRLR